MGETLTVAVLGAPKVGKTAIVRQFLYHDFTEKYSPTEDRYIYRPSVMLNGNSYDLKIMDVPYMAAFPANSSQVSSSFPPPSLPTWRFPSPQQLWRRGGRDSLMGVWGAVKPGWHWLTLSVPFVCFVRARTHVCKGIKGEHIS